MIICSLVRSQCMNIQRKVIWIFFWLCHKIQTAKVHILLWKLRVHFGRVSMFYITKTYMNCYNCSSLNSFVWNCNNSSNGSENSIFISLLGKIISVHFGNQYQLRKTILIFQKNVINLIYQIHVNNSSVSNLYNITRLNQVCG